MIFTNDREVCGDHNDIELVNGLEFLLLCEGSTGHAGQLGIHSKIVLKGNSRKGFAFPLHLHAFLGFDGLMQPFAVPSSVHQTAREFIDDDNFAVLVDIVHILFHQAVGADGLVDMM